MWKGGNCILNFQLDEEGIGRVTVSDNALDELDTVMVGGILPSQIADIPDTGDYKKYLNFTGCMSGNVYTALQYRYSFRKYFLSVWA